MAVRSVGEAQWVEWSHVLQQVAMATTCQESLLEELHDQMERELMVMITDCFAKYFSVDL